MHADKIRTANVPALRLEPKDAIVITSLIGIAGYVLGLIVGLAL
jgi:hypothetical protein